mmetsp:Transcript_95889/g.309601  ORF Transcript_95889/g.309601 Transcript_95889/m.309601 type:complete len:213 (+) Transcript_95889:526-1164(+)
MVALSWPSWPLLVPEPLQAGLHLREDRRQARDVLLHEDQELVTALLNFLKAVLAQELPRAPAELWCLALARSRQAHAAQGEVLRLGHDPLQKFSQRGQRGLLRDLVEGRVRVLDLALFPQQEVARINPVQPPTDGPAKPSAPALRPHLRHVTEVDLEDSEGRDGKVHARVAALVGSLQLGLLRLRVVAEGAPMLPLPPRKLCHAEQCPVVRR